MPSCSRARLEVKRKDWLEPDVIWTVIGTTNTPHGHQAPSSLIIRKLHAATAMLFSSHLTIRTTASLPPLEVRPSSVAPDPAESRGAPPPPQDPSPLRGTLGTACLSRCSGGLRPLVQLCVEPAGVSGRCTMVTVPLRQLARTGASQGFPRAAALE